MDFQILTVAAGAVSTILTVLIKHYFDYKKLSSNERKILERLEKQDLKQLETDANHSNSIEFIKEKLENNEKIIVSIKNAQEILNFRNDFQNEYKKKYNEFIDSIEKKEIIVFLKSGVLELSNIFDFILKNEFQISENDFKNEVLNSEITLKSKFKNCEVFKKYKENINYELNEFFFNFKNNIKDKTNGHRLKAFRMATEHLTKNIISKIAND
jgi:hypothetical protein